MKFPKLSARGDAESKASLQRLEHWGIPAAQPEVRVTLPEVPAQRPQSFASLVSKTGSASQSKHTSQSVIGTPAALPSTALTLPKGSPAPPPARFFSQRPSEAKAEKE